MMHNRQSLRFCLFVFLALTVVGAAFAAPYVAPPSDALEGADKAFKDATALWQATFTKYGLRLFWLLAAIDLTWNGIRLTLKGADIQEFFSDFVQLILTLGFFLALLQFGTVWVPTIIESFVQVGNEANAAAGGGYTGSPSAILDSSLNAASNIISSAPMMAKIVAGLCGLIILLLGTAIACMFLLATIEMYIVVSIGILFFGFGGSRWTRDYSTKILTYAVSVGVKLMLIQLIVGLGTKFTTQFLTACSLSDFQFNAAASAMVAMACVAYLVKAIPQTVQSIINGVNVNTGGFLGQGAAMMAMTAKATAATATGGTAAVVGAVKLAAAQGAAATAGAAGAAGTAAAAGAATGAAAGASSLALPTGGSAVTAAAKTAGVGATAATSAATKAAVGSSGGGGSTASAPKGGGPASSAASSGDSSPSSGGTASESSTNGAEVGSPASSSDSTPSPTATESSGLLASTDSAAAKTSSSGSSSEPTATEKSGLTTAQAAASSGGIGASILKGIRFAGRVGGNLGASATRDIGKRLSGDHSAAHGLAGFRMAKDMMKQANALKAPKASGPMPGDSLASSTSTPSTPLQSQPPSSST